MSRVLVVDDQEENAYYLRVLLEADGRKVDTARNGAEALAMARQAVPDLVISDLLMPVMDGFTLLRHWKADPRLRQVPFMVYTATYSDPQDERLARSLGADAFILKPTESYELLACIRDVEARGPGLLPSDPEGAESDGSDVLRYYSDTLIRKLETKTLELAEANRILRQDAIDRELSEVSLRESERRFRQLAENINELFWVRDHATHEVLYVSPAFETIWGRKCQEFYDSPTLWSEALHPDDRDRVTQATARQVAGDYNEVFRIVRPDGGIRWIHSKAFPVRNEQGEPYRIVGTAEDITERHLAEERIAEQAALLDHAQDAILVRDLDHRLLYWNKGAERMYGWTAAEVVGRSASGLIYKGHSDVPGEAATEQLLKQGRWNGEVRHVTKAGAELLVETRWSLLRDDRGEPKSIFISNTDVTERRRMDRQFLRAQRMESVGTLAAGIAHDLNNVLSPILMSVELLKDLARDDRDRTTLEILETSALRGADLVKQVLAFSRGVEGARIAVDPTRLVADLIKLTRDTFPRSIHLIFNPSEKVSQVIGDPTQLHQVMLNLLVNARDAMPRGGSLTVTIEDAFVDDTYAAMNPDSVAGAYVKISVADSGSGISAENRTKVFEPFFTTKGIGEGTGLGLSTTLAIVRSHRGFINLYSEVGKGTCVTVYLPSSHQLATAADAEVSDTPPRGHGETVLVVDDEESVRYAATRTLEEFGYRVLVAVHGADAVSVYARHKAEIAIVLTDMAMPVMDGAALVVALMAMNPSIRIIASSGLASEASLAKAMAAGVKHFVAKPYTAKTILTVLHETLAAPFPANKPR
ncbi:MAG: response regulator [Thermoanaerobaculia bacterium]